MFFYYPCKIRPERHQDGVCHHSRKAEVKADLHMFFNCLVYGLMENFREAQCYFRTKHRLLARMYLPLIFVNVYRKEEGVGSFSEIDGLFWKVRADREFIRVFGPCSHSFDHPENFAYNNGQVRILDYGEKGFENLLTKYGDRVEQLLLSVAKTTD